MPTWSIFLRVLSRRGSAPKQKGTFMPLPSICRGKGQASERSDRWWSYQGRRGVMEGFRVAPESLGYAQIVCFSLPGLWPFSTMLQDTWSVGVLSCMHKFKGLERLIIHSFCLYDTVLLKGLGWLKVQAFLKGFVWNISVLFNLWSSSLHSSAFSFFFHFSVFCLFSW